MADFDERLASLPRLGIGVSTEYGAREGPAALDPLELRRCEPSLAAFMEVGVELAKGLDANTLAWCRAGHATTYHFLDINLDEHEDLDAAFLAQMRATIDVLAPRWLCGDAGLWHFGARDRGQMLLLPPVLEPEAVAPMAAGVIALREATGLEVLPENPPGPAFVGRLHILEFFAALADRADTGLLLDCAHLAMFQRARGHALLDGFDAVPWDRVVEVHVAGGSEHECDGFAFVEDDHGPEVLADTWLLFEAVVARARNLRAVVVECERNPIAQAVPLLERVRSIWGAA